MGSGLSSASSAASIVCGVAAAAMRALAGLAVASVISGNRTATVSAADSATVRNAVVFRPPSR